MIGLTRAAGAGAARGVGSGRQFQYEKRSAARLVLARDLAAVILDDPVGDAQSQAGSFSDRLGRIKGIEYPPCWCTCTCNAPPADS